jgi:hypothetical protein
VISIPTRSPSTRSRETDRAFDSIDRAITLLWTRRRPVDFCNTYDARARAAGSSSSNGAEAENVPRPRSPSEPRLAAEPVSVEPRAAPVFRRSRSVSRGPIGSSEGPELVAPNPFLAPIAHPIVARASVDEWNLIDRDARARQPASAISREASPF